MDSRKTIFMTGATGNMGREAVRQIAEKADTFRLKVLVRPEEKSSPGVKEFIKRNIEVIWGDLADIPAIHAGVKGADTILHIAALVSPLADRLPASLVTQVNVGGTQNIVDAIHAVGDPLNTRLVYIGSIAQTGSRNAPIHWGRTGDPIKISAYDHYAVTKTQAEAIVAQSGITHWVSLRQSGIAHYDMWRIMDPIMFHNPLNGVFEWTTAHDSGRLMAAICGDVPDQLWRGFYNIGGGHSSRVVNHEFMQRSAPGFHQIFRPHWFATRNFHGQWYSDSDILESLVPFREQSLQTWFDEAPKHMPWIARTVLRVFPGLVGRKMKDMASGPEGTLSWLQNDDTAKIEAYFGSRSDWDLIPHDWDSFDFEQPSRTPGLLDHGYDETHAPDNWTIDDLKAAAEFRGGQCLSTTFPGPDAPCEWQSSSGHRFTMTPRLYIKGGHWCPITAIDPAQYKNEAARNPFFAQVWSA